MGKCGGHPHNHTNHIQTGATVMDWFYDIDMYERRVFAMKLQPVCDKCGTQQVQLVSWSTPECEFKCRCCKHTFTIEVKPK